MSFKITSKNINDSMYPGMIITYKVTPLLKIPLTWVTEITHVKENNFFVDEQKIGPYKLWHHQHILKEVEEGVLMIDIITYQPPLGFIGALLNFLFIKKKVTHIFKFRYNVLEKLFNKV